MHAEAETGKIVPLNPLSGDSAAIADQKLGPIRDHMLDFELLRRNLIVGFESTNSEDVHPFSVLRSQLLKHVRCTGKRIFGIMSVQPANGKSHVAINLAAALARIHPTILVELDLRRPSIGNSLGLPSYHAGIDDYLAGTVDFNDTGIQIHDTELTVHRVRNPNANPEAMLSSGKLLELTEAIRNAPDAPICIIDTPPAVIHDDIMLIAPAIESVIMVVQEGRTSKRALLKTIKGLSPTPVIGTVLNMSISSPSQTSEYGDYYLLDTVHQPA